MIVYKVIDVSRQLYAKPSRKEETETHWHKRQVSIAFHLCIYGKETMEKLPQNISL